MPKAGVQKQSPTRGLVLNIMRYATHDGPGIRTTVFLKGCPLRCLWCHNPESQRTGPEIMFSDTRCVRCGECIPNCEHDALSWREGPVRDQDRCTLCGRCIEACPADARRLAGREMTVPELVRELEKDRIFYEESDGGITFSGGEPFSQPEFLEEALGALGARGIHRAVDTSGLVAADTLLRLSPKIDLFLYDLKALNDERHTQLTGVSNRIILSNLRALAGTGADIVIRVPLVAGMNDGPDEIEATGDFLAGLALRRVDLLPYHEIGRDKYRRLGRAVPPQTLAAPASTRVQEIAERLTRGGLLVRIGDQA